MDRFTILISGDYNAFNDGFNGAGVYMASGLAPSNSFETPFYIGSAMDLRVRIMGQHIPQLESDIHKNRPFQGYYVNYGRSENLVWWLLESCSRNETLLKEQLYLDEFKPFADSKTGFNIAKDATAPMKGRNHTAETKQKIASALKAAAVLVNLKTGQFRQIRGFKDFAKEIGADSGQVSRVANGKRKTVKGWRLATEEERRAMPDNPASLEDNIHTTECGKARPHRDRGG